VFISWYVVGSGVTLPKSQQHAVHASSVHEHDMGEDEEKENPPLKGKRAASEDA
jgi:hypothetical protein